MIAVLFVLFFCFVDVARLPLKSFNIYVIKFFNSIKATSATEAVEK